MNKFSQWIKEEDKTQQQVADDLGVTQGVVSAWCSGDRLPRPENMQNGEVQPNDFYGDKE